MTGTWQIRVDTGGTFTDCLALDPAGALHRAKVLSSSALRVPVRRWEGSGRVLIGAPSGLRAGGMKGWVLRHRGAAAEAPLASYDGQGGLDLAVEWTGPRDEGLAVEMSCPEEAPVLAAHLVTGTPPDAPLPPLDLRLATTLGTNALLERKGAATALLVTRGFADLLVIGNQQRPELFALRIDRPAPLYEVVAEVEERLDATGEVLQALEVEALAPHLERMREAGIESVAVALLHSYRNPRHERRVAALLQEAGFRYVSVSAAVARSRGYLVRAETTLVDAYLAPVLGRYLERIDASTGGARTLVMTSAGGLSGAAGFRPKDGLLSGPAGGVVGASAAGERSGFPRLLSFDMGGTSTDVARYDGAFGYVFEHQVGGARLLAPAMAVETVAAGGGLICLLEQGRLQVGPESGGADPGPACYGAGGPLCVTDVNLLLGRLVPSRFHIPLEPTASREAFGVLEEQVAALAAPPTPERLLEGLLRIANETMADAIRRISLRQGYDPTEFALLAFGGAGPQHATAVASLLGMVSVVVPEDAGLLSAVGLGEAAVERFAHREVLRPLREITPEVPGWWRELESRARAEVMGEGVPEGQIEVRRRLAELRFLGQESTVQVEEEYGSSLEEQFDCRYRELYGYLPEDRPLELVSMRVVAAGVGSAVAALPEVRTRRRVEATERARSWFGAGWHEIPLFHRAGLVPGDAFEGPALVVEAHSTTVVEPGWEAVVDEPRALVLSRCDGAAR